MYILAYYYINLFQHFPTVAYFWIIMDAKKKILIQNLYLISENVFLRGKLLDLEIWILLKFMVHVTTFYICKYFSISCFFIILFLRFNSVIFFIFVRYDFKFNFIPGYLLILEIQYSQQCCSKSFLYIMYNIYSYTLNWLQNYLLFFWWFLYITFQC